MDSATFISHLELDFANSTCIQRDARVILGRKYVTFPDQFQEYSKARKHFSKISHLRMRIGKERDTWRST